MTNNNKKPSINIIGAGLAGAEAAYASANLGIKVNLYEMRKAGKNTNAHKTDKISELVCSNSLRNSSINSAIGLLHEELRILNSLIIKSADINRIPAGGALAVDRENFASYIDEKIKSHPGITICNEEITEIPENSKDHWIIATGPLTSDKLSSYIKSLTQEDNLAFFDAISPIIYSESIDMTKCWFQSRYDKTSIGGNGKEYLNCPMNKEEYENFIELLIKGDKTSFKDWEKNTPYFEACLPIEVMAERGMHTLRYGPMKPVGLTNPNSKDKPYAVVQLRPDNKTGSLLNMVGFQTKLKYEEQKRIFRTIKGLENAEFARMGGIHRNTFIKSPLILNEHLKYKKNTNISFAGQITGVEGYVESAATGLIAAIFASKSILNKQQIVLPQFSAIGSLVNHITSPSNKENFQPMNINFGLFPELEKGKILKKKQKAETYPQIALSNISNWYKSVSENIK